MTDNTMQVVEVESINKRKYKVKFDNNECVPLYFSEVRKLGIEEGLIISDDQYQNICDKLLYPRAKDRVLYILGKSDKTEKQLREKLKEEKYPDIVEDKVIEFLKKYDYIDDERFARTYIKLKSGSKSMREMERDLYCKGVDSFVIKQIFNEFSDDIEKDTIIKILSKNKYKDIFEDEKVYRKAITNLMSKGFGYDKITRCIKEIHEN